MRAWQLNPEEAFRADPRRFSRAEWESWMQDPRTAEVIKALHRKFLDKTRAAPLEAGVVRECILVFEEVARRTTGIDISHEE